MGDEQSTNKKQNPIVGLIPRIEQVAEPVIEQLGLELVLVEFVTPHGRPTLRFFIDRLHHDTENTPVAEPDPQSKSNTLPAGVTIEDCTQVSRELSALLDVEDIIPTAYELEVSSPGLNRPLTKPVHFTRHLGHTVRLKLKARLESGARNVAGKLDEFDGETLTVIDSTGKRVQVSMSNLAKANIVYEF